MSVLVRFSSCSQTFINTAGGPLSLARDYIGLQVAMQKVVRVSLRCGVTRGTSRCVRRHVYAMYLQAVALAGGNSSFYTCILVVLLQDDNNVPISKATASTPPAATGYILEYEHGQVRNGTAAVVGST
jgi:hypothetical protein